MLHGVDVGDSRFLRRPSVRRAADFAAEAHRGQVRKTQEPYVAHCVHTALIVEGLLSPSENDERWAPFWPFLPFFLACRCCWSSGAAGGPHFSGLLGCRGEQPGRQAPSHAHA